MDPIAINEAQLAAANTAIHDALVAIHAASESLHHAEGMLKDAVTVARTINSCSKIMTDVMHNTERSITASNMYLKAAYDMLESAYKFKNVAIAVLRSINIMAIARDQAFNLLLQNAAAARNAADLAKGMADTATKAKDAVISAVALSVATATTVTTTLGPNAPNAPNADAPNAPNAEGAPGLN